MGEPCDFKKGCAMNSRNCQFQLIAAAGIFGTVFANPAHAALSAEELAKIAQNPVGAMISVPFQNNTNLNYGPEKGTQNVLNIQPVIPVSVSSEWNIITRTILPVISQPALYPGDDRANGIGDLQFSAMLSPAVPVGAIWGVGAIVQAPTNSNGLGNDNWGLGPQAVVLKLEKGSPWVYGVLVNNIWSLADSGNGGSYNNGLIQPFLNYNFPSGFYVNTVPMITVNWKAASDQRWTVPLGAGIGKVFHFGPLPVNTQLGAYYNVVKPDDGPDWQIRFQVQLMFPK
jgi:hypothetical protein